ncbi:MAG: hypothetical protein D6680_03100 [Cyanobacteria bacterium J007]|nr:MAG: hypothetical protein D6680_03100 [Cyanobacteria bacterium J007]
MLGDADLGAGQSFAVQIGSEARGFWGSQFSAVGGAQRCRSIALGDLRVRIALESVPGEPDGMKGASDPSANRTTGGRSLGIREQRSIQPQPQI